MPSLRGHHLLCLHFFNGEGYSPEFIRNLEMRLQEIEDCGAEICSGADDICRKCTYLKDTFCQYTKNADKEISEMDTTALRLLGVSIGSSVSWDSIKTILPQIFSEWYRRYCQDCSWEKVCNKNKHFRELKGG